MNSIAKTVFATGLLAFVAALSPGHAAETKPIWPANLVTGESLLPATPVARDWKLSNGVVAAEGAYTFVSAQANINLSYNRSLDLPFALQAKITRASENHSIQVIFPELGLGLIFSKQFQCLSISTINADTLAAEREIAKVPYSVIGAKISSIDAFTLTVALGESQFAVWLDGQPIYVGPQLIVAENLSSTFRIRGGWNSAFDVSGLTAAKIKTIQFPTVK